MCLYNYNKENKKYKHLTYAERTMIETWYNQDHKNKKEIAVLLHNRLIRRWIPKGIDISTITTKHIQFIEDWINNYPRAMFDYNSSKMILLSQ